MTKHRQLLDALRAKPAGRDRWMAKCPCHDDRSPSLSLRVTDDDRLLWNCHAGCDQTVVGDALRGLGWDASNDRPGPEAVERKQPERPPPPDNRAAFLWSRRQSIVGTLAERYLREARGYGGAIPPTLAYLPATKPEHHPALIAAYAIPDEPEPGTLRISEKAVKGVQLTLLKADGTGKADVDRPKLTVGQCPGVPIVLAPMNDLLGLAITEGIEDGLSIFAATGLGVWAAGGASRMPALAATVPAYCDCISIITDDNRAGHDNTRELAARLRARGLYVESVTP